MSHKGKQPTLSEARVAAEAAAGDVRGDIIESLPPEAVTLGKRGFMHDVDKAPMAIELALKAEIPKYKSAAPEMFEIDTPTDDKPGGKPKPGVEPTDARVLPLRCARIGRRLRLWGDVAESI